MLFWHVQAVAAAEAYVRDTESVPMEVAAWLFEDSRKPVHTVEAHHQIGFVKHVRHPFVFVAATKFGLSLHRDQLLLQELCLTVAQQVSARVTLSLLPKAQHSSDLHSEALKPAPGGMAADTTWHHAAAGVHTGVHLPAHWSSLRGRHPRDPQARRLAWVHGGNFRVPAHV